MTDITLILFAIVIGFLLVVVAIERSAHQRLKRESVDNNMMVALLSHRLRTPLGSIKWHVEMLLDSNFGKLQISQLELLNQINHGIGDAIGILNVFLESARIERGAISANSKSVDLWKAVDTTVSNLEKTMKKKHTVIREFDTSKLTIVQMDPLLLHMILEVILHNAILYTPENGTITIASKEQAHSIVLSVRDTGIGMTADEQKHLFSKFFRAKKAQAIDTNGNGLGLYLVKEVLLHAGGSIRCESEANAGSCFIIEFPSAVEA
ncbi:MAG: sensor signal transduction histidine kinase [Candidatus Peribacteria bacterium]|nr:sensor signal transduction histidine kinase [Candidatus Peribacteria bacterium]